MDFTNNYTAPITLAAGTTSAALSLPDGQYLLTLADSESQATRWEIVAATVAGGAATLTRGQEGTTDQLWSSGSVIYMGVTAGLLAGLFQRIDDLEQTQADPAVITSILARLDALEAAGSGSDLTFVIQSGQRFDGDYTLTGFETAQTVGSLTSGPSEIGGVSITVEYCYTSGMLFAQSPPIYDVVIGGAGAATPGDYLLNGPGIPADTAISVVNSGGNWSATWAAGDTEIIWPVGSAVTVTLTPV